MTDGALSQDELRELYRELILDHARAPRHFGKLENPTHSAAGINPLCGDKLHLYLNLNQDNTIDEIGFEGTGCAISIASASLLTDAVVGLQQDQAVAFSNRVIGALADNNRQDQVALGKLRALAGVREFPSRVKCATLAWHALNSAVLDDKKTVSTES